MNVLKKNSRDKDLQAQYLFKTEHRVLTPIIVINNAKDTVTM